MMSVTHSGSGVSRTGTFYTCYSENGEILTGIGKEDELLNALIYQAEDRKEEWDQEEEKFRILRDEVSRHWWRTTFGLRHRSIPILPFSVYSIYVALLVGITVGCYPETFVACKGQKCLLYNLAVPVQLVTGALFFLLTFRTDLCYDRWWEGRTMWGAVVVSTTNIVINSIVAMGNHQFTRNIIRWAISYPITLKAHIRRETEQSLRETLETILVKPEVRNVMRSRHRPNHVLTQISSIVQQAVDLGMISPMGMLQFDMNISSLQLCYADVDRIAHSPMPFAHTSHSRTFMLIWLAALPCCIVHDLKWLTIPVSIAMGYCILGVEAIADEIENPFGKDINDLDLDTIVYTCQLGILQCLDATESIEKDVKNWSRRLGGALFWTKSCYTTDASNRSKRRNELASSGRQKGDTPSTTAAHVTGIC